MYMFCFFSMWKLIFGHTECSIPKASRDLLWTIEDWVVHLNLQILGPAFSACLLEAVHTFNPPVQVPHLWHHRVGLTPPLLLQCSLTNQVMALVRWCHEQSLYEMCNSVFSTGSEQWKAKKRCVDVQGVNVQLKPVTWYSSAVRMCRQLQSNIS